ncbi:MAG: hypothetical protein WB580_03705, partial [Candidatus Binataceae bacterium]
IPPAGALGMFMARSGASEAAPRAEAEVGPPDEPEVVIDPAHGRASRSPCARWCFAPRRPGKLATGFGP